MEEAIFNSLEAKDKLVETRDLYMLKNKSYFNERFRDFKINLPL